MNRILCILCLFSLFSCNLFKQASTVGLDSSAEALIAQGKRLLRSKNYADAMDKFEMAWQDKEFHRSSTAAMYLSGLSAYFAGFDDIAEQRFEIIVQKYPKSRYTDEAKFHLALISASNRNQSIRIEGLEELVRMNDQSTIPGVREQAMLHVQQILFEEMSLTQLESSFPSASGKLEQAWMEALGYRLVNADRQEEATRVYQSYLDRGGKETDFLRELFPEDAIPILPARLEPNIFRIAMVLPFYQNRAATGYYNEIPAESQRGLEFYEGFQLAVEMFGKSLQKEVYLKTYDTQRDTLSTKSILGRLDILQPDLIVGEIYNTQSRIISDWAEQKKVPQIIPLSPTETLVQDKFYTFLAHPSVKTHGAQMARYAWEDIGLTHVSVFTDQSAGTQPLALGFMETFLELGGTVDTLTLHPNYEIAIEQIPELVEDIPDFEEGVGVYIPLMNNEESAGLIVNLIKQRSKEVTMMGSPHFRSRYNTLSRDTKEGFELLFSTSHMHSTETPLYRQMYNRYLEIYKFPPSDNVIQGYDLGRYIMNLVKLHNPPPFSLDTYLRASPKFEGIHLDYWFDSQQSNQHVNIGQYTEEGLIRVK